MSEGSKRGRYPPGQDPALDALLHEHGVLSQRDNNVLAASIALAGVGAVIVGAVLLTVPDICSSSATQVENCIKANRQWQYLMVPLPLLALFSILTVLAIVANSTAQMLHKVERTLWDRIGVKLPPETSRGERHPLPVPSGSTMSSLLVSFRPARATRSYRRAMRIYFVVVAAVLVAPVIALLERVDPIWQVTAALLYGPPLLLVLNAFLRANGRNRRALRDAAEAAEELNVWPRVDSVAAPTPPSHSSGSPCPATSDRPLWKYLLLPRKIDLLLKSFATLLGMALVTIVVDGWRSIGWSEIGSALLVLTAFEFLLYQGRYILNDLRDLGVDELHPMKEQRGRSSAGGTAGAFARLAVATLRVAGWLAIAVLVGGHTGHVLLRYGLLVLVLMLLYDNFSEFARNHASALVSKHHSGAERKRWECPEDVPAWPAAIRLLLVAPGYAFRGLVGTSVAFGAVLPWGSTLAIGLSLAAAEAANVGMGWVLEGSADVHKDKLLFRPELMRAPHIAWLARSAGLVSTGHRAGQVNRDEDRRKERVLLGRREVSGLRIWNLWAALAVAASAPAGVMAAAEFKTPDGGTVAVSIVLGLMASLLLVVPRPTSHPWDGITDHLAVVVGLVVALGDVLIAQSAGLEHPWWASVIPMLVTGLYYATRLTSAAAFQALPANVAWTAVRVLLGQGVADRLVTRASLLSEPGGGVL